MLAVHALHCANSFLMPSSMQAALGHAVGEALQLPDPRT